MLHTLPSPHVPQVEHELDTQNFEHFDEDMSGGGAAGGRKWGATKADPNFIGYTYKNWEAVHPEAGEPGLGGGGLELGAVHSEAGEPGFGGGRDWNWGPCTQRQVSRASGGGGWNWGPCTQRQVSRA